MRARSLFIFFMSLLLAGAAGYYRKLFFLKNMVSICLYPFLMVYGIFVEPLKEQITRMRTHAEYRRLLERNFHERSELLQELIKTQAELNRSQDIQQVKLPAGSAFSRALYAQIIYKQLKGDNPFFIIDQGTFHGVMQDMIAVFKDALLGRVTEVYPGYARVMPLTHPHCYVPIVCSKSHAHGVFHENKLDFISHLEPLVAQELVITSGEGLIYPRGLAVGRIKDFSLNDLGFLYDVALEPLYDIADLRYCALMRKEIPQGAA